MKNLYRGPQAPEGEYAARSALYLDVDFLCHSGHNNGASWVKVCDVANTNFTLVLEEFSIFQGADSEKSRFGARVYNGLPYCREHSSDTHSVLPFIVKSMFKGDNVPQEFRKREVADETTAKQAYCIKREDPWRPPSPGMHSSGGKQPGGDNERSGRHTFHSAGYYRA